MRFWRRSNRALCIAEGDELKTPEVATADFHCYRLRRSGGYSAARRTAFAKKFRELAQTSDVYAYFRHEDAADWSTPCVRCAGCRIQGQGWRPRMSTMPNAQADRGVAWP